MYHAVKALIAQLDTQRKNLETTDQDLSDSFYVRQGIEKLMQGFPEFGVELGPCRVLIWHSPEVTREFYWFESQQKGYINP